MLRRVAASLALLAMCPVVRLAAKPPEQSTAPQTSRAQTVTVLSVSTDDPERPYVQLPAAGLRDALKERSTNVTLYSEYFDQVRFGDRPSYSMEFRAWLWQKYKDRHLDAIVVRGQAVLQLFADAPDNPWKGIPIVYGTIGHLTIDITLTHPTTSGVVMENHFPTLMSTIKALLPATRRIATIRGASDAERTRDGYWLPQVHAEGLEVLDLVGLPVPDLLARVSTLPVDTVPVFIVYQRDPAGRVYEAGEVQTLVARATNRPLFSLLNIPLPDGLVGGPTPDYRLAGREMGRELLARLDGKPPSTITIPVAQHAPQIFDAWELARWGIAERLLPSGSVIRNRPPSLWRDYRSAVVGTLAVATLLVALVGALLIERRHRTTAQHALQNSYVQLQQLTNRVLTAQEEERARIARELHDDIGQRTASFSIALSRLRRVVGGLRPAEESVVELQHQAHRLSADLRQLSHDLHPSALEHLGLLEALRARCDDFSRESAVAARLDVSDNWRDVPDHVELCLYRVAQEALRNVATHAHATNVTVSLECQAPHVIMRVSDNGRGFDQGASATKSGLGLISLHERVRMLGGTLAIHPAPGVGTTMAVTLPVDSSHAT